MSHSQIMFPVLPIIMDNLLCVSHLHPIPSAPYVTYLEYLLLQFEECCECFRDYLYSKNANINAKQIVF